MTSDHCVGRHVGDVGEDADAGVVDQDVEPAEARDRRGDRALDLVVAANVGLHVSTAPGPALSMSRPRRRQMRFAPAGDRDAARRRRRARARSRGRCRAIRR